MFFTIQPPKFVKVRLQSSADKKGYGVCWLNILLGLSVAATGHQVRGIKFEESLLVLCSSAVLLDIMTYIPAIAAAVNRTSNYRRYQQFNELNDHDDQLNH